MKDTNATKKKVLWVLIYAVSIISLEVFLKIKFADFFSLFPQKSFLIVIAFLLISVFGFSMAIGLIKTKKTRKESLRMGVSLLIFGIVFSPLGLIEDIIKAALANEQFEFYDLATIVYFAICCIFLWSVSAISDKEPPMMSIITAILLTVADIVLICGEYSISFYLITFILHAVNSIFIIFVPEDPTSKFEIISNVVIAVSYVALGVFMFIPKEIGSFIKNILAKYPIWINLISVSLILMLIYGIIYTTKSYVETEELDGNVWSGISLIVTSILYVPAIYCAFSQKIIICIISGLIQIVWLFFVEFKRNVALMPDDVPLLSILSGGANIVWIAVIATQFEFGKSIVFLVCLAIRFIFLMLATWLPNNIQNHSSYSSSYSSSDYSSSFSYPESSYSGTTVTDVRKYVDSLDLRWWSGDGINKINSDPNLTPSQKEEALSYYRNYYD